MSNEKSTQPAADAAAEKKRTHGRAKPKKGPVRTFIKTRRDQPSVLWDGKRVIARFSKRGLCRTRSPEACEAILDAGFTEVLPGQRVVPTPFAEPDPRMLKALQMELADEEGLFEPSIPVDDDEEYEDEEE